MNSAPGLCARVQLGELEVAIPASACVQAVDVTATQAFPRRAGALCETASTRWGVLPLVDLALWLPCGVDRTPGPRALLLRDEAGRALAVRVSALRGVLRPASVTRLHQDDQPEELFQSAVHWRDGGPPAALLEVSRLMALGRLWAACLQEPETATTEGLATGLSAPTAAAETMAPAAPGPTEPHAVVLAGGARWAVPASRLVQALPAPPLEYQLPAGPAVRGITSLHGRKLPVVDLAVWGRAVGACGPVAPSSGRAAAPAPQSHPVIAVLAHGELRLALRVDAVQQLLRLPAPRAFADRAEPVRRVLAPGLGEVQVIDVERLFAQLPEVEISRPRGAATAQDERVGHPCAPPRGGLAAVPAHLLFEADATYAAHVRDLLQVLPLPAALGERLLTDPAVTLPYAGEAIPVVPLPAYSGSAAEGPPSVALVLRLPTGQRAALAVHRLLGWVGGAALEPGGMRTAATGQLPIVTVTRAGQRRSHVVVDLAEVAQALT